MKEKGFLGTNTIVSTKQGVLTHDTNIRRLRLTVAANSELSDLRGYLCHIKRG